MDCVTPAIVFTIDSKDPITGISFPRSVKVSRREKMSEEVRTEAVASTASAALSMALGQRKVVEGRKWKDL